MLGLWLVLGLGPGLGLVLGLGLGLGLGLVLALGLWLGLGLGLGLSLRHLDHLHDRPAHGRCLWSQSASAATPRQSRASKTAKSALTRRDF